MKSLLKPLAALLLVPIISFAGWKDKAGEALPDTDFRKSIGEFGVQLIFVGNEKELFEKWAIPSRTVDVSTVDSVRINEAINAFVLFSGCKVDEAGNCNVSMRFRVLKPDGSLYAGTPPMEVWHDKPAPIDGELELSVQYLKIVIEPTDPLGEYQVQAQIRDNNSEKVLQLSRPFKALPAEAE